MSQPHSLYALVYVSQSSQRFNDADLAKLMKQSTEGNARNGITGALLHKPGWFMQFIEGDMAAVQAVYKEIRADKRHFAVRTVSYERIRERQFAAWSMLLRGATSFSSDSIYHDFFKPEFDFNYFLENPEEALHLFSLLSNENLTQPASSNGESSRLSQPRVTNQRTHERETLLGLNTQVKDDVDLLKVAVQVMKRNEVSAAFKS